MGRTPVDQRLLGLDRRTIRLPLIAVAIALLWIVVMPQINSAVKGDEPVHAGAALIIGKGTTMAPPVGWNIEDGVRVGAGLRAPNGAEAATLVTGDGINVSTKTGTFAGSATALVDQVLKVDKELEANQKLTVAKGGHSTVTLDGHQGVVRQFKGLAGEGAVFGFVQDGRGLTIAISGDASSLQRDSGKLARMLNSVDFDQKGF